MKEVIASVLITFSAILTIVALVGTAYVVGFIAKDTNRTIKTTEGYTDTHEGIADLGNDSRKPETSKELSPEDNNKANDHIRTAILLAVKESKRGKEKGMDDLIEYVKKGMK